MAYHDMTWHLHSAYGHGHGIYMAWHDDGVMMKSEWGEGDPSVPQPPYLPKARFGRTLHSILSTHIPCGQSQQITWTGSSGSNGISPTQGPIHISLIKSLWAPPRELSEYVVFVGTHNYIEVDGPDSHRDWYPCSWEGRNFYQKKKREGRNFFVGVPYYTIMNGEAHPSTKRNFGKKFGAMATPCPLP